MLNRCVKNAAMPATVIAPQSEEKRRAEASETPNAEKLAIVPQKASGGLWNHGSPFQRGVSQSFASSISRLTSAYQASSQWRSGPKKIRGVSNSIANRNATAPATSARRFG